MSDTPATPNPVNPSNNPMGLGVTDLYRLVGPVLILAVAILFVAAFIAGVSGGGISVLGLAVSAQGFGDVSFLDKLAVIGAEWATLPVAAILLGGILAVAQYKSSSAAVSGVQVGKISALAAPILGILIVVFAVMYLVNILATDGVEPGTVLGIFLSTIATSLVALVAARIGQLSLKS